MKTCFIIFNCMTTLDFVGVYDALTRLKSNNLMPEFAWDICSFTTEVADRHGLRLLPQCVNNSLADYDMLIVPGGVDTRTLQRDSRFFHWLRTSQPVPLKASVCTGSLLLGAAGFLRNKRATTHRIAFEELKPYCRTVVDDRIVDEGEVITARGVTSAIDLGLYLVERLAGAAARKHIGRQMDYPMDETNLKSPGSTG